MNTQKRNWRRFVVLSVALAFASVGCNGNDDDGDDKASCSRLCEDAKDCMGSDQSVDCRDACDQQEALADRAGCSGQYDDLVDCVDHLPDICQISSDDCMAENEAVARCMQSYCEVHPDDCVVEG